MSQTSLFPCFVHQFFDANGDPLAGGKLYFYDAGTSTAKSVYSDSSGTVTLTNPVILDSAGRTTIWISGYYKVVLQDSLGNQISSVDNVSSQYSYSITASQWNVQADTLTYIAATQFSVVGDLTATYHAGRRIQAVVGAGTITGTITASTVATSVTTVTVLWDSGSLDSGLSSVSLGILTIATTAIPIFPVVTKTANYSFAANDVNQTFHSNSANAVTLTLLGANLVPSGSKVKIRNINTGNLTLSGSIDVVDAGTAAFSNPVLHLSEYANFYSDSSNVWKADMKTSVCATICTANLAFGTALRYLPIQGAAAAWGTDENTVQSLMPSYGTVSGLYVQAANNDLDANTTVILRVDKANTSLTANLTANDTTLRTNNANRVAFQKGQCLDWAVTTAGTAGNVANIKISARIQLL